MTTTVRLPLSLLFGFLISAALFYGLSRMIVAPEYFIADIVHPPMLLAPPVVPDQKPLIDPLPTKELYVPPVTVPGPVPIVIDDDSTLEHEPPLPWSPPGFDRSGLGSQRGGLVSGEDREARLLYGAGPGYPPNLEARGVEGWVRVRFSVAADGRVRDAQVVAAEPVGAFDRAALDAVRRWRYQPKTSAGVAVDSPNLEALLRFSLQ